MTKKTEYIYFFGKNYPMNRIKFSLCGMLKNGHFQFGIFCSVKWDGTQSSRNYIGPNFLEGNKFVKFVKFRSYF